MSKPKVSVIIPTYNRADLIQESIDSVLDQTYQDFEIVIIDDGSTDSTKEVVESYNNPKIKYFYQENSGLNAARNAGIRESSGDYIAYLDSDDIWLPEKLDKQVGILEKNPEIGLVYCGSSLIDELGNYIGVRQIVDYSGWVFDRLVMYNFLYNGSIVLFRRSCLDKVGLFDETVKRMTDWEFYLRFSIHYKYFGVPEYLIKYRVHNKAMSSDYKLFEKSGYEIIEKTFAIKDLPKCYWHLKNKAYAMRYRYVGRRYFERNSMKEAREFFSKALNKDFSMFYSSDVPAFYLLSYFSVSLVKQLRSIKQSFMRIIYAPIAR